MFWCVGVLVIGIAVILIMLHNNLCLVHVIMNALWGGPLLPFAFFLGFMQRLPEIVFTA